MDVPTPHRKTLKRYDLPGHIHELTFSCHNRLPLLTTDRVRDSLAKSIVRSCEKHDYSMVAYVFMPTHVHLLVMPNREVYSISDFLKTIKTPVARKELSYLKMNEPDRLDILLSGWNKPRYLFWLRGGGFDRNIIDVDSLENAIHYIHNNPVRKCLVTDVLDWKWSSAWDWLLEENGVIPVVKKMWI